MISRFLCCSIFGLLLLSNSGIAQQESGPEVGTVVDEFSLQDQNGTSHKLSDLLADGPVALVVFRSADW